PPTTHLTRHNAPPDRQPTGRPWHHHGRRPHQTQRPPTKLIHATPCSGRLTTVYGRAPKVRYPRIARGSLGDYPSSRRGARGVFVLSRGPWGCGVGREPLRHLIVIVPGIGGSVLADDSGAVVWGNRRALSVTVVRPERLSLGARLALVPVGLLQTMTVIPGFFAVPGYDTLVRQIRNTFEGSAGGSVRVDVAVPGGGPGLGAGVGWFSAGFPSTI